MAGFSLLCWILGGLVAVLALLAASTGLCVGCEFYRIGAHIRGVRSHLLERVDLDDFEGVNGGEFVSSSSPIPCALSASRSSVSCASRVEKW